MKEARAEFRTKIAATINKAKSCELGENRDNVDIQRDQEYMAMDMEEKINSLFG